MLSFALGAGAAAAGYRLEAFDAIGSTNAEAMARARAGDPGNLWLAARRQTAGRGRRGRAWQTPDGNLAASILTILDGPATHAATLGFVAGLALEEALCAASDRGRFGLAAEGVSGRFRLKWPNDVLADGAKLAGILLEAEQLPGDRLAVVAGMGVNVAFAPDIPGLATAALAGLGAPVAPETLFAALTDAWVELAATWNGGRGFPAIRARWLDRAAGLGAPVVVRTDRGLMEGLFETIDAEGRLVVRAADGTRERVAAGEVHFGAAATVKPDERVRA